MTQEVFDVVVIGAGIAGIAVAEQLNKIDQLSWVVLEEKDSVGGTWDTFRYPGVRSDSDIDAYRFSFLPWRGTRPLGSGQEIREYLEEAATHAGMDTRTRFGHRVQRLEHRDGYWHIVATCGDEAVEIKSRWVHLGCGYYDHHQGHQPQLPGEAHFKGLIVDPQHWPEHPEHPANQLRGKNVSIIGSGATATSLAPALHAQGAQVSIVQRTANHMAVMSDADVLAPLRRVLAAGVVDKLDRARAIQSQRAVLWLSRKKPDMMAAALAKHREKIVQREEDREAFRANYPLWTQRVCRIPDGDLLHLIDEGEVAIHHCEINGMGEDYIELASGKRLHTDVLIKATGLQLLVFGGIQIEVSGTPITPGEHVAWRGMMLNDVPNLSFTLGYVNDSYTLRAELVASFLARMLQHMRAAHLELATPEKPQQYQPQRIIDLASGYVNRGIDAFPVVCEKAPWTLRNHHARERRDFLRTELNHGMRYSGEAPETTELRIEGTRCRVQGEGQPIIAIHGIGRGLEDWEVLAPEIVARGMQLISLDIPGFGESPRRGDASIEGLAASMWQMIDELGLGQGSGAGGEGGVAPILLGHSLGGLIVQAMLRQRPDAVAGLVLLAPSGFSQEITPIVRLAAKPVLGTRLLGLKWTPLLRAFEQATVADPGRISDAVVARAKQRVANPDRAGLFADISANLLANEDREALARSAGEVARESGVPVRILWGAQDKVISSQHAAQAEAFYGQEVLLLEGCGHMVATERPQAVLAALEEVAEA
ncbi:alpha/beta fold hydrolase [Corynebacterium pseudopelargi]|nr:alpha/beta fold hydrolase [Corynebacterium pseudopelargi]